MQPNGCPFGIGDGVGMTNCAKLQGVAKFLAESYAESEANGSDKAQAIT